MSYTRVKVTNGNPEYWPTGFVGWLDNDSGDKDEIYNDDFSDYWYHNSNPLEPLVQFDTREECINYTSKPTESRFKVGDIVERVTRSNRPDEFGYIGHHYKVLKAHGSCVVVVEGCGTASETCFRLVKAVDQSQSDHDTRENYKFKVGDKVVTNAPVIVCDDYKGVVGSVSKLLEDWDYPKEVVEIEYSDGMTQVCYVEQDSLELAEDTVEVPEVIFDTPDGGPAEYYDFPQGAITLNDLIEHKQMGFHRGNIFKACWRWGTKSGTTTEYDARKIIYSGARLLMSIVGVQELRKTLQKMLDDPQFNERSN